MYSILKYYASIGFGFKLKMIRIKQRWRLVHISASVLKLENQEFYQHLEHLFDLLSRQVDVEFMQKLKNLIDA